MRLSASFSHREYLKFSNTSFEKGKLGNNLKTVRLGFFLSNGHSPANLSNSSTRRKLASFVEFEYSPKWSFWKIGRTQYIRRHWPPYFARTQYIRPTFANHFPRTRYIRERQIWRLLHEFSEFGEFGKCRLDRFIHIKYVICA
jgi:hypothetical protein